MGGDAGSGGISNVNVFKVEVMIRDYGIVGCLKGEWRAFRVYGV